MKLPLVSTYTLTLLLLIIIGSLGLHYYMEQYLATSSTVLGVQTQAVQEVMTDSKAEKLIQLYPDYPYSYLHFAYKEFNYGNYLKAQDWYDKALDRGLSASETPLFPTE